MQNIDKGLFLVIEGSDGSGKGTQFKLLVDRLKSEGYEVETFDFPQYDQESSYFVREYLKGNYGTAEQVGPYTGSLFYALDRYQSAPAIKAAIDAGKIVIANRFTGSNMAHQGTKFDNNEERKGYFLWLDAIEFQMLGIPRPNLSLVLRVPAKTAQNLINQRNKNNNDINKKDIHEADIKHLEKAVEVYDNLCELFPKDFKQLDCVRNNELLDVDAIHNLVWESINPMLPSKKATRSPAVKKHTSKTNTYFIPSNFDAATKKSYVEIMDTILEIYTTLQERIGNNAEAQDALRAILPVATSSLTEALDTTKTAQNKLKDLAESQLAETHSAEVEPITLNSTWPRNEFDIIPDMLYAYSALPLVKIKSEVNAWSYDKKVEVFDAYTSQDQTSAIKKIQYSWDIIGDYGTFQELYQQNIGTDLEWQELTPRYGYDVPTAISEASLTDDFEKCFDLSLKLYSILQSAGHTNEAQYATLLGHRMRWKATFNASETLEIHQLSSSSQTHSNYRKLAEQMNEKIAEVHPQIARTLLSN